MKPLVLYNVDRGVVMEPMQGKLASSQFDFGYTEKFCIPGVTSVFFSSCDSVVGASGVQSSQSRLRTCLIGKTQLLWTQCKGIRPHLADRGSLMGFLELQQEPGVYSRVTVGMSIRNWSLFSEFRTPI